MVVQLKCLTLLSEGYTQKETATLLNTSQTQVSRMRKKIAELFKACEAGKINLHDGDDLNMPNAQFKIAQTKDLLKQGVKDRKKIAKELGVTTASASTYINVAEKTITAPQQEAFKKRIIASDFFIYTLWEDKLKIEPKNKQINQETTEEETTEVHNLELSVTELCELIEDLKELYASFICDASTKG